MKKKFFLFDCNNRTFYALIKAVDKRDAVRIYLEEVAPIKECYLNDPDLCEEISIKKARDEIIKKR